MKSAIITFFMIFSVHAHANEMQLNDAGCANVFVKTQNASGKLNTKIVDEFLHSLNCGYFSSAEGGEFGNELIFMVIEQRPGDFVSSFSKLEKSLKSKIISEIESPIHDGFDFKKIYHGLSVTKLSNGDKNLILKALKVAGKNNGVEVE